MAFNFAAASSQYLEAGSSPISTYPITMSAWVKLATLDTQALLCVGTNGGNARFQLAYLAGTDLKMVVQSISSAGTVASALASTVISSGVWYHVCAVISLENSRRIFINGTEVGTNFTAITVTGLDRFLIGARRNSAGVGAYANAEIADAGFWNVAFGENAVRSLGKAVSARKVHPDLLRSYHPLIRENVAPIGPAFTAYNSPTVAAHPRIYY